MFRIAVPPLNRPDGLMDGLNPIGSARYRPAPSIGPCARWLAERSEHGFTCAPDGRAGTRSPASEGSRHVAGDTRLSFASTPFLVPVRLLPDQLIDAASHEARGDRHVDAAERVAERERRHPIVAQPVMLGDPVLQRPQLLHVRPLNVKRDTGNRRRWLEPSGWQQDVAVWLGHALDNKLSARRPSTADD
jgi:hypothetical protein